jgi:stage II sporulation protein P
LYENGVFDELPVPIRDADSLLVNLRDTIFHPPVEAIPAIITRTPITAEYTEQLMDFAYIRNHIFLEDPSTILLPTDIDPYAFLKADLRIDPAAEGPHVLIFHTHSTEWFVDTSPDDPLTGIMGVGRALAEILSEIYGLEVLHYMGRFDVVEGRPQVMGAYERMEPVITQLLADNPTIQLVIDLHRDGVRDGAGAFTRMIDGEPTAQLMFFNGLSRRNVNGQPVPTAWLPNPYQTENLQLSFQAQLAANALFPGLNRRIYLRAYRFSLHMHPRTLFVEVGNQYNTLKEAKNAMQPLARIIAEVMLGE